MSIYGCKRTVINEEFGLLELAEITISFAAADLRRFARFLNHYVDQVELGRWRSDHAHLVTFDREWQRDHPEIDVIIANPDPKPPARLE
jgi:hypothetical protein